MNLTRLLRSLAVASLAVLALASASARAWAAKKELNLFAWSEYIPQAVLDGFEKESGIKVNYETFASGEEMLAKIIAGGSSYDLIQPTDYISEAMIKEGLLVPLDFKKLPHFDQILPQYLHQPFDPEQKFTVPYMTSTVGIVVNTAKVKKPINGFKDVFVPENKGRIVVVDDGRELVTWALYSLGKSANDITPETIAQARPVLQKWLPLVKLFDSDSPKTALLNGDVDLGVVWGGEAATLWAEDPKFQYVLPAEGTHQFYDLLAVPKGAKNIDAAHAFIDYILRPEVSKLISDEFPYTNPNGGARAKLTAQQRENPASYPTDARKLEIFRHIGDSGALIDEMVTDLKNAL